MLTKKDIENLTEVFATKKDIENLTEVFATKDELIEEIKKCASQDTVDEVLSGQDEILEKLNLLLEEKSVGDAQDKRKTKVLEIHNGALKRGKILSEQESLQIDQLGAF